MYIDDLKPFADTQHGLFLFDKKRKRLELQNIQFGVDLHGTVVRLTEKGWCDISAAGKKQMGRQRSFLWVQGDMVWNVKPPEGSFIVSGIFASAEYGHIRRRMHRVSSFLMGY